MLYQTVNPHGGDLFGHAVNLDFSVNTNPLGTPESVVRAVVESAGRLCQYPDPGCRELTKALASREGVAEKAVLCGCGAAELIYAYCGVIGPGAALLTAPAFSEYEAALDAAGVGAVRFFLREEDGFAVKEDFLTALRQTDCHTVFLCNPNNPTGLLIHPKLLLRILEKAAHQKTVLVVDECFLDFTGQEERSLISYIRETPYLFILKSFTKMYAMPGIRLGYGISGNRTLLDRMEAAGQCWGVSVLASGNYAGLGEGFYRVAVKQPWENQKLLESLGEIVSSAQK